MTFPTRLVQSVYLDWFHRRGHRLVARGRRGRRPRRRWPSTCTTAPTVARPSCSTGAPSPCSSTSSCSPSATSMPSPAPVETALAAFAAGTRARPTSRAGHTAEQDLSALAAGGGRHRARLRAGVHRPVDPRHRGPWRPLRRRPGRHAALRAERSRAGHPRRLAPRRAVPVEARLPAAGAAARAAHASSTTRRSSACSPGDGQLDFRRDVLPLVVKEIGWAYYHELFLAHPERTTLPWDDFAGAVRRRSMTARRSTASSPRPCPTPPTASTSRRSTGRSPAAASSRPRPSTRHVAAARRRRRRPPHRPVLQRRPRRVHGAAAQLRRPRTDRRLGSPDAAVARRRPRAVVVQLLHVLRQRTAARPAAPVPGPRRGRAAALHRRRHGGHGRHRPRVLRRPQHQPSRRDRRARALVDARIAAPSVSRTADRLLRRLHERGDVVEEVVSDDGGWTANTGKVLRDRTRPAPRPPATARATRGVMPSACSPAARRPAPSPAPAPTPRRSASTIRSPGPSSRRWHPCNRCLPSPVEPDPHMASNGAA